jgi:hypothetical protein
MSGLRDPVAERRKLAHALGVGVEQLAMLESVPADDIQVLRQQVAEALFEADRHHFARIAALAKALPAAIAAKLTEAAFPPLLAARTAELLEPGHAVEMVVRLSDGYSADVAAVMDASRAAAIVAAIPPDKVSRVARELAGRKEWVVMGGFVAHVGNAALNAAVAVLDGEQLLRISFVLDDLTRMDPIGEMLTDRQLDEVLAGAARHGLWRELGDLVDNLAPERVARLADRFTELDQQLRAQFDDAAAAGRFDPQALAALHSR